MNNSVKELLTSCWNILSEVPGWPDAPRRLRIRRVIPIIVPVAAILALLLWNLAWNQPRIRSERARHQPVLALSREVENLQLACTDQYAAETAAKAADAGRILFPDPKQIPPALDRLQDTAAKAGWEATFHAMTASQAAAEDSDPIRFIPVRGRLAPARDNAEPFSSLLTLLEKMTPAEQWIDLTRLTLRADDQGRYTAELQLRAGCRPQP